MLFNWLGECYNEFGDTMITIYKNEAGKLVQKNDVELNTWINISHHNETELKEISEKTGIHYELLIKLMDNQELSRVELRDGETLIVLKLPIEKEKGYRTVPLGIIITPHYLVSVCDSGESFFQELLENHKLSTVEKTNFVIQVIYKVASTYLSYLQKIEQRLEQKEKNLYTATSNDSLKELLQIEKSLVYFHTALNSNELVLERIMAGNVLPLFKSDDILLEDAVIENKQAISMANLYQALLANMTESYGTIISNNLNQVMKFLAGMTIVISIPTMISSFMGMNVDLGFFHDYPFAFLLLIFISLVISLITAYIFKRKNWL